jgi:hypothetical protein
LYLRPCIYSPAIHCIFIFIFLFFEKISKYKYKGKINDISRSLLIYLILMF